MKNWKHTPFIHYNIIQIKLYYKLIPKASFIVCAKCKHNKSNLQCKFKLCVNCCAEYLLNDITNKICKVTTHINKLKY